MINIAVKYIEDSFHMNIDVEEWQDRFKLPHYLSSGYDYKLSTILSKRFIFVSRLHDDGKDVELIIRQISRINDELRSIETLVLVFKDMNAYVKEKLIKSHISFVVPGKQIYILELGAVFNQRRKVIYDRLMGKSDNKEREASIMTPTTQALFLNLMVNNDFSLSMEKISKQLRVTRMSISRSFDELLRLNLLTRNDSGSALYRFTDKRIKIWDIAQDYLVDPIMRTIYVDRNGLSKPVSNEFVISGESALAELSNLSHPKHRVYGLTNKEYKSISHDFVERPSRSSETMTLQLFRHALPTRDRILHPLALALVLKRTQDERVESELAYIVDQFFLSLGE